MKLWHREGGQGHRRLVLIHGLGANADVWSPLEKHLDRRWLMMDLRGHGRSVHLIQRMGGPAPRNLDQTMDSIVRVPARPTESAA